MSNGIPEQCSSCGGGCGKGGCKTKNYRPTAPAKCDHGRVDFDNCPECRKLRKEIRGLMQPLADEFWERRGAVNIEHLLQRAYRMGMRHTGA